VGELGRRVAGGPVPGAWAPRPGHCSATARTWLEDIQTLAYPTLRHRILINYRAEAEGIKVEDVIRKLLGTREVWGGQKPGANASNPPAGEPALQSCQESARSRRQPGRLIDPQTLMSIKNLELRARVVVEGFWSGIHRSPYHGFSVEFTEYRQYTPGMIRGIWIGGSTRAATGITSRNSRTKRTCAAISWSITAGR
jgi:hypothetical protein